MITASCAAELYLEPDMSVRKTDIEPSDRYASNEAKVEIYYGVPRGMHHIISVLAP